MAIQHTVVFRLTHESGSSAEQDFLDSARETLTSIPGVDQFTVNRQVNETSPLTWQFSMVFIDQSAYDAYMVHPAHVSFVENRWKPEVAEFQELDFVER